MTLVKVTVCTQRSYFEINVWIDEYIADHLGDDDLKALAIGKVMIDERKGKNRYFQAVGAEVM